MDALDEQIVTAVSTEAAGLVIQPLARQLVTLHAQQTNVVVHLEVMVEEHPACPVLTAMPGTAIGTTANSIAEASGKTFSNPAALVFYVGLTPTTRQSGNSIKSERVSQTGNNRPKRVLFLSAFASIRFPASREYYNQKRAQGKRHNQTLFVLAHRRPTALFAMIRDGSLYDVPALKIA